MGSVTYTIARESGSAYHEYQSDDDAACVKFFDTIKAHKNCTFAQLFFSVGSTKKYVGPTIYSKSGLPIVAIVEPKKPVPKPEKKPKKDKRIKRNWAEFLIYKKGLAREKAIEVMQDRASKLRDKLKKMDEFTRQDVEAALGMKRATTLTLLRYMREIGIVQMSHFRRGATYRFVA